MRALGVLGGGASGLAAALFLRRAGAGDVALFEAAERVGGWVQSERSPQGHLWECGPRTLRPVGIPGAHTLQLVRALGLEDAVRAVPRGSPAARTRLVYVDGKLHTLPSSMMEMLQIRPPFTRPLAAAVLHDLTTPRKPLDDESIYDFVARRFGKEIADYAVSPLVCGICAGDAQEISVKLLMTRLFELEQQHGSVCGGLVRDWMRQRFLAPGSKPDATATDPLVQRARRERWAVYSLRGGLETLMRGLADAVRAAGADLRLGARVERLSLSRDGVSVSVGGRKETLSHVVSALPARALAPLVAAEHPTLAAELAAIPFATVGVASLTFRGRALQREAFGFLVPPAQGLPLLGVVFDSCCFPDERGDTILTAMLGGRWFDERIGADASERHVLSEAVRHASRALGLQVEPESSSARILRDCIPQYVVGHTDRVRRIREYIVSHELPLTLCGCSYDGVGLNDVLLSARQAVLLATAPDALDHVFDEPLNVAPNVVS